MSKKSDHAERIVALTIEVMGGLMRGDNYDENARISDDWFRRREHLLAELRAYERGEHGGGEGGGESGG